MRSLVIAGILVAGCATAAWPATVKIKVSEYREKVFASWLGQCIGNVYGLPHENKYIDQPGPSTFPYGYSANAKRLKETGGVFSDDDTDIEYLYLLAMEKHGAEPTLEQLAQLWKYHVRDRVWLANRAALAAIQHGYTPPVTGSALYNPHWFQIDPQLINEIWAVTAPGMVEYAAQKTAWASRIMDDRWGIEPAVHYGAMYAAAFFESDVEKLIDIGTGALPPGSRFAGTVEKMKSLYRQYPQDWHKARAEMARLYYLDEPAGSKTIWNANLNGAAGILALLYGRGDFQKTLDLACAMGFDADNQAATMSGLIGLIGGRKGLPDSLLFPFPELGWKEPLNNFYKNVTRHDMPDASLSDMAARMAAQGEKIILAHGGRRVVENGEDYYVIDTGAKFAPPLELPAGPMPYLEAGERADFEFPISSAPGPVKWSLKGDLPKGLRFRDGKLAGNPRHAGVSRVTVEAAQGGRRARREFVLVVRNRNLSRDAERVLASVERTDTAKRDAMWLTVSRSLYAPDISILRDGRRLGDGSTFYSITEDPKHESDFYGYEWPRPQSIGLIGYHTGSMEENGGWFTSLNVEYKDDAGSWKSVEGLVVTPPLAKGDEPFNKPHFVEYLLAFEPVRTKAIRMTGGAGGAKHWKSEFTCFTSISELGVYGPLPGYRQLSTAAARRSDEHAPGPRTATSRVP